MSILYVSDGGHWENLGLVELLRRRCTEIYCISAAGDGLESFATIGEAIALAEEECGVDIDIDLTPLRPGKAPETGRRLLRPAKTSKDSAGATCEGWCPASHAVGTFTYRDEADIHGSILIVEANLTSDVPWDIQAWAEANAAFPDDPTTDQRFDYRQFESYLRLGRHQMKSGIGSPDWIKARSLVGTMR